MSSKTAFCVGLMTGLWLMAILANHINQLEYPQVTVNGRPIDECVPHNQHTKTIATLDKKGMIRCEIHESVTAPMVETVKPVVFYIEGAKK